MKKLYLVRHARAVSRNEGIPDFERSLDPQGNRDARKTAKKLVKQKIMADLLVSSPANRALQTAHGFAAIMAYPAEQIALRPEIYELANGAEMIGILRSLDNSRGMVMLFGHEPGLSQLASELMPWTVSALPKAGVLGIQFDIDNWSDLQPQSGKIDFMHYPLNRDKREKVMGEIKDEIRRELAEGIRSVLERFDPNATGKIKGILGKSTSKLAERFLDSASKKTLLEKHLSGSLTIRANDKKE